MNQSSFGKKPLSAHPVEDSSDEYESAEDKSQEYPEALMQNQGIMKATAGSRTGDARSTEEQSSASGNLEDELLRIKNLATGKEIAVEKVCSSGMVFCHNPRSLRLLPIDSMTKGASPT
jgi:hypothetical protein